MTPRVHAKEMQSRSFDGLFRTKHESGLFAAGNAGLIANIKNPAETAKNRHSKAIFYAKWVTHGVLNILVKWGSFP